ncbi:MAG: hypothetical protein ABF586_11725, partial [Sporolactobacillus sp.]
MKMAKEEQYLENEGLGKDTIEGKTKNQRPVVGELMVCVSGSPFSRELIRSACQMADDLKVKWIALYVDAPRRTPKTLSERMEISRNLRAA